VKNKYLSVFIAMLVSSLYFFVHVILDDIFSGVFGTYLRVAINHIIIAVISVLVIKIILKNPREWGLNLWNLRYSIYWGIIFGVVFGLLFNVFLFSTDLVRWNFAAVSESLRSPENIIHFICQLFITGTTEEIVFRGILLTMLMGVFRKGDTYRCFHCCHHNGRIAFL